MYQFMKQDFSRCGDKFEQFSNTFSEIITKGIHLHRAIIADSYNVLKTWYKKLNAMNKLGKNIDVDSFNKQSSNSNFLK